MTNLSRRWTADNGRDGQQFVDIVLGFRLVAYRGK